MTTNSLTVAFLGLGAMGSRMAANLLKAGFQVNAWNRDASKTEALRALGAGLAHTPREAAEKADVVISMLRDDVASRYAWLDMYGGALAVMKSGSIAIESSTLTHVWVRELAQAARQQGVDFLDAPVLGSRPQAEAAQLIYLVGGQAEVLQRAEPVLKSMGGAVHHVGAMGSGAVLKLMANALFGIQVAAMAEMLGLAAGAKMDAGKALEILATTPVLSPAARIASQAMIAQNFAPMFPVALVEKDLGYTLALATEVSTKLPLTHSTHAVLHRAIAQGFGEQNLTAMARLYV
jgi:3-hydroxyisobutyrate dehydrogenase